ncbi:uncharacterized protein LACBIDRAFT_291942 [Laccaria bicolor S238N-H82]|uniref:Predicted protein n=1 Tax=Laccaria bicolor (strain S238N-H82 / ATCC MYA-4686) TaxID=486041 RepID=B0CQD4_LACBS|nr:uncharacterized protein LACBIDRAFT_291942 [Laccaria bicolor S238N-H82]EDR16188.1 predicted protein [Laccaria bicolor S238N-H82]|eukprot:XP_001874396.1 predicted protein [Laccaria bicolor S238N-H82]
MFLSSRDLVPDSPRYLPEQWSPHVHPEGQIYFSRSITLRVVTDSCMYTPSIAEKVTYWVSNIEKRAADRGFVLSDSVELYIQIDDEDRNYYLADQATHSIFWLDEYEISEMGLLPLVLQEHYWSYVKNHPMHFGGLDVTSNYSHKDDNPESSYPGQSQNVNTPADPCNTKAQMFQGASGLSIRDSEFYNTAGNLIKISYNVYPQPGSEHEQLSLKDHLSRAISGLKSELKSEIFHAIATVKKLLPCPFSTMADIPLEEKVANDALKYPPLLGAQVLMSKTSLYIPGVMNQLLSSVRYSFY